jgi:hypothetical protein
MPENKDFKMKNMVLQFGDYPYNNKILDLPDYGSSPKEVLYCHCHSNLSRKFLYSLDDDYENWKNPEQNEMFWFRWITGHQTMFILWFFIAHELMDIVNTSEILVIEQKLNLCANLFQGCYVLFEYAASCSVDFYSTNTRPWMAIFHKGFSGRWSSDYQLIPSLVDHIIKSQYPEELKKSQKAFKQAFIDNQKNHYRMAKRLIPSSDSLSKEFKNAGSAPKIMKEHHALYDYFFLVRRSFSPESPLYLSLSERIKAIILDLTLNSLHPEIFTDAEHSQWREKQLSKYKEETPQDILFKTATALYPIEHSSHLTTG